uniref:(northern house mosquito) hypothetical protein n=1 Tax=Culex pipiens TaxID=7175 RepID=A0A8D8BIS6_CULPI
MSHGGVAAIGLLVVESDSVMDCTFCRAFCCALLPSKAKGGPPLAVELFDTGPVPDPSEVTSGAAKGASFASLALPVLLLSASWYEGDSSDFSDALSLSFLVCPELQ